MKALSKRIARLEQATLEGPRPSLVILHAAGVDPESLVAVDGVDLPRMAGEGTSAYLARLDDHVRSYRGRALPLVTFAVYPGNDAPDAKSEEL